MTDYRDRECAVCRLRCRRRRRRTRDYAPLAGPRDPAKASFPETTGVSAKKPTQAARILTRWTGARKT